MIPSKEDWMSVAISVAQAAFVSAAGLLVAMLPLLFFQNRRTERVARSMQNLLLAPSRAKVTDAKNMLSGVLDDAVRKISETFEGMTNVLNQQIARADTLEKKLGVQNKMLVSTADVASERIANMTKTLENLIGNLSDIVRQPRWEDVRKISEGFNDGVEKLMKELESRSEIIVGLSSDLNSGVAKWSESGRRFSDELQQNIADNTDKINMMSIAVKGMNDELSSLQRSVVSDFESVRRSSGGVEGVLANSEKLLARQLENMENFTGQARKLLQTQVNVMADTASKVGTEIRLAESSIEVGANNLAGTSEKLFSTSKTIKETFDAIAREIMDVRAKFQTEVGEFANTVVQNLENAQSAATHTMEDSRQIASVFGESLVPMLARISETVAGLDNAKSRIQPLADLMGNLDSVLPKLSENSDAMTADLTRKISEMAEKINSMNDAAASALNSIGDTTLKLEKLSGGARQQMIDLVSDYAKAAESMRELTGGIAAAASVPARTAARASKISAPAVSVHDFIRHAGNIMEKLHDLSVDLTRSIGAEIPDSVMAKYNSGDRAIFSKWFAKMISGADKKKVRGMFKTDAVFRSQATQFVHGFAKMMTGAERTENKELVVATLLKTDLGIMYQALRACL
jgi:gas vesicle protein